MYTLNCSGKLLKLDTPLVMGIINATPDSFYVGSRVNTIAAAVEKAVRFYKEGATLVDVGGQSTRPGAERIAAEEEADRILPIISAIQQEVPELLISVDTFYSSVARQAVAAGAVMVNDVSGGSIDPEMIPVVGTLKVPYICMHMKGTPENMQFQAHYDDVVMDVLDFFTGKLGRCRAAGIKDVIIDVGIGFGKTAAHSFKLLRHLDTFQILGVPMMVGLSRKSLIYKSLGIAPEDALNGTTVLHTLALQKGVNLLRVHDVKEAVEAIRLHAIIEEKSNLPD